MTGAADATAFVGTDYLGLSHDRRVRAAAIEAVERHGVSASAARTTTGTHALHLELEASLAAFIGTEDAVVLASGGHAAAAVVEALGGDATGWWVDAEAHHSSHAALRGRPHVEHYRHLGAPAAAATTTTEPRALITDTIFPTRGAVADLAALHTAMPADAVICLDDSHGIGVLGTGGRGAPMPDGATPRIVRFGSLAKALGGFGGFVAGDQALCDAVRNESPSFATSTALPPSLAAAVATSLQILTHDEQPHTALCANVERLRNAVAGLEFAPPTSRVPIFFLPLPAADTATRWHDTLRDDGLLVPVASYGAGTEIGLRGVVTARHDAADIDRLGERLRDLADNHR